MRVSVCDGRARLAKERDSWLDSNCVKINNGHLSVSPDCSISLFTFRYTIPSPVLYTADPPPHTLTQHGRLLSKTSLTSDVPRARHHTVYKGGNVLLLLLSVCDWLGEWTKQKPADAGRKRKQNPSGEAEEELKIAWFCVFLFVSSAFVVVFFVLGRFQRLVPPPTARWRYPQQNPKKSTRNNPPLISGVGKWKS